MSFLSSVESRPFLCRPTMGRASLRGEFCGGTGVPQLYRWAPEQIAHPHTVLWGMEAQLRVNGVDGQDAETGLFTPVLQHPSSVHRHKRGKAITPKGDRFSRSRGSGLGAKTRSICFAHTRQRGGALFPVLPSAQKDRRIQAHSGSSQSESPHC